MRWPWYVPAENAELNFSVGSGFKEMLGWWVSVSFAWQTRLSKGGEGNRPDTRPKEYLLGLSLASFRPSNVHHRHRGDEIRTIPYTSTVFTRHPQAISWKRLNIAKYKKNYKLLLLTKKWHQVVWNCPQKIRFWYLHQLASDSLRLPRRYFCWRGWASDHMYLSAETLKTTRTERCEHGSTSAPLIHICSCPLLNL